MNRTKRRLLSLAHVSDNLPTPGLSCILERGQILSLNHDHGERVGELQSVHTEAFSQLLQSLVSWPLTQELLLEPVHPQPKLLPAECHHQATPWMISAVLLIFLSQHLLNAPSLS